MTGQAGRAGQRFTVISNSLLPFFTEGKHGAEQQIKGETVTSPTDTYLHVAGNVHCNQSLLVWATIHCSR